MMMGAALLMAVLASCNAVMAKTIKTSDNVVDKEVAMDRITGVTLAINARVVYTQGDATTLRMHGPDNIVDEVRLVNKGGMVTIKYDDGVNVAGKMDKSMLMIYITSPSISDLVVSGSGDIDVPGRIDVALLNLVVSGSGDISTKGITAKSVINATVAGSGDIEMDLATNASELNAVVAGSGDIECENVGARLANLVVNGSGDIEVKGGHAATASITISGSGDVNARRMQASTVNAVVAGSGDVICNATTVLNATISGSGEIKYVGTPQVTCATRDKPSPIGL